MVRHSGLVLSMMGANRMSKVKKHRPTDVKAGMLNCKFGIRERAERLGSVSSFIHLSVAIKVVSWEWCIATESRQIWPMNSSYVPVCV